jgi:hypothetical protein
VLRTSKALIRRGTRHWPNADPSAKSEILKRPTNTMGVRHFVYQLVRFRYSENLHNADCRSSVMWIIAFSTAVCLRLC